MILEVVQSKWSLTWYDPLGPRMCVLELMLRSRKTISAFPCCYALDLLGLVDGEMYDKWKVKVDTTQINFKELYFR